MLKNLSEGIFLWKTTLTLAEEFRKTREIKFAGWIGMLEIVKYLFSRGFFAV